MAARTLGSIVEKFRELKAEAKWRDQGSYSQEHEEKLKVFCEEEHTAICLKKLETSLEVLQEQLELGLQCKKEGEDGIFQLK
eukprot:g32068.t1